MPPEDRILVARIGAPHGVEGRVRLQVFAQDLEGLARGGPFESEDGARKLTLVALRPGTDMAVARFRELRNRNEAAAVTRMGLVVPRWRLPPITDEDEFYLADLIGLRVEDPAGVVLGDVVAVPDYGAGDLVEVAPTGGGATELYPFTKAFFPIVDIEGGRIVLDLPDYSEVKDGGPGGPPGPPEPSP